jgi:hypothetical protein
MLERLQYQAGHFSTLLLNLQTGRASGSIYIDTTGNFQQKPKSRVLVLQNGEIVYGGLAIPSNNREFAKMMGIKLNHSFVNTAIKYAEQRLKNPHPFENCIADATHYLTKPVEPIQLLQIVDKCVNPSNIISFA